MHKVRWASHERVASSVDAVEAALAAAETFARANAPLLGTIEAADGATLSIGLGADRTVLNYVGSTLEPPYFTSAGGTSNQPIAFVFGGTLSEYPGRNAISKALALSAVREFCILGERPRVIAWEEV